MTTHRGWLLAVLCVLFLAASAFAGDPPARVARLNYMSGQVSIQPNGVEEWVAASVNRPLTSSDRLWTDRDSRAELQLGDASLRTNNETSMTLVNVSDNNVQIQLDQGTMNLHVTELFDGEVYEVDTPNISFVVRKRGDYRLDVDNAGDTTKLTVFKGEGEVTGDGPSVRAVSGTSFTFNDGRSLQYAANHNPGRDGFDDWCFSRADREDRAEAAKYVSRYAVGYSDLDDYGYWETVPAYGPVWYPRQVVAGWAPYRYGHWIWVGPWGWTWVDDSPWGFAPYHYGRWVNYGSRWGWCPGPVRVRPIYAPALVGWIGGAHFGVGLSFGIGGGVGWFPLGWGEPYIPYYGHSRGYFQNVNVTNTRITNITYVTNNYYNRPDRNDWHYANRQNAGAVTAVSNDTFRNSRPTRNGVVRVNEQELKQASVEREVALRPTTNSMLGSHAGEAHAAPPAGMIRPSRGGPGGTAESGDRGRPGRNVNGPANHEGVAAGQPQPGAPNVGNAEVGRQGRDVPRPNDRPSSDHAPANAEAAHTGQPAQTNGSTIVMPSRVPRPGQGAPGASAYGRPGRGETAPAAPTTDAVHSYSHPDSTPPTPNVNTNRPERNVPRPTEGQVIRQDPRPMETQKPAETPRPERMGRDSRHDNPQPQQERVQRGNDNANVARPPAHVETPQVHTPPPATHTEAPAPKPAEPPHQNAKPEQSRPQREERKPQNNGGSASLRYPSPYNSVQPGSYRPASLKSTYTPSSFATTSKSFASARPTYSSASSTRAYTPRNVNSYSPRPSYTRSSSVRSAAPAYRSSVSRGYSYSSGRSVGHSSARTASSTSSGGGSRRRG